MLAVTIAQKKIIDYMEQQELSRADLARKIGVNKSTITRILNEGMIIDSRDTLQRIEQEIGINNDWTTSINGGPEYGKAVQYL
ncbi:helix-turn-helix domain-containing protein [Sediminispirochaeta smaragdinae]|uniref:helix-turn-helix domain-containing protein n=1 Tax=Sediminispirochaeta smaragdinae TaxID=55206 RepID=UPI0005A46AAC|nr:helix-turn-helix transcriptional regulator [Sediminispirochaeta smaragdinae]